MNAKDERSVDVNALQAEVVQLRERVRKLECNLSARLDEPSVGISPRLHVLSVLRALEIVQERLLARHRRQDPYRLLERLKRIDEVIEIFRAHAVEDVRAFQRHMLAMAHEHLPEADLDNDALARAKSVLEMLDENPPT